MKLRPNEVVNTMSGRKTSAFPAKPTVKSIDSWLQVNVINEAKSRNDDHIVLMFQDEKPGKFPIATREIMNNYLFGFRDPF